jgi:hypothetical protein
MLDPPDNLRDFPDRPQTLLNVSRRNRWQHLGVPVRKVRAFTLSSALQPFQNCELRRESMTNPSCL